jgi:hypothetical protein
MAMTARELATWIRRLDDNLQDLPVIISGVEDADGDVDDVEVDEANRRIVLHQARPDRDL